MHTCPLGFLVLFTILEYATDDSRCDSTASQSTTPVESVEVIEVLKQLGGQISLGISFLALNEIQKTCANFQPTCLIAYALLRKTLIVDVNRFLFVRNHF